MKKLLLLTFLLTGIICTSCRTQSGQNVTQKEIAPGVFMLQTGEIDTYTPYSVIGGKPALEEMAQLPQADLPFDINDIHIEINDRGCAIEVPLDENEQLYGFGLQFGSFTQRGLRKQPIVNDNSLKDLGYSHAPETFYVSTKGYGIIVNTARYTTFLCGSNKKLQQAEQLAGTGSSKVATSTEELYQNRENSDKVYIDVPGAKGIEIMVLTGPSLQDVVKRYNLLSGGGCLPPMWGLGFKYRVKGDASQEDVLQYARYFRENNIPCDILGLEPGWQTATYSCSYVWNKERFPDHKAMIDQLKKEGFKVNLWEHAYIHPSSPIRAAMTPYSGDFLVWNGLVPDFLMPKAREIFTNYHRGLIEEGISGFKLDECDNSNIGTGSATWCFPDMTQFPSGIDGEQMHQMYGSLYINTVDDIYRDMNLRTYHNYRGSGLFMSYMGGVLYSDMYKHKDYIQALCTQAFGGLLWCPEVREASSEVDFFHRLQTVLLSPMAMVNAWYLRYAPWLQFDYDKNGEGIFLPEAKQYEDYTRTLINMRMQLVPYLYNAFYAYRSEGTPPFRPLVMDYPEDERVMGIDNQYMIGEGLMAAPLSDNENTRIVYFPEGTWYNFYTNEKYEGNNEYEINTPFDQLPLYVKEGTLLPLAEPVPSINEETTFKLHCKVYGTSNATCQLFEDDGVTYDFEKGKYNLVTLTAANGKVDLSRDGDYNLNRYEIADCEFIK